VKIWARIAAQQADDRHRKDGVLARAGFGCIRPDHETSTHVFFHRADVQRCSFDHHLRIGLPARPMISRRGADLTSLSPQARMNRRSGRPRATSRASPCVARLPRAVGRPDRLLAAPRSQPALQKAHLEFLSWWLCPAFLVAKGLP
jgi:hypothetical protein